MIDLRGWAELQRGAGNTKLLASEMRKYYMF